jgi:hypothetical protein
MRPAIREAARPQQCRRVHAESDPDLGTPLCADCYHYACQIAFNRYAPELAPLQHHPSAATWPTSWWA